jgi:hypothetical protein
MRLASVLATGLVALSVPAGALEPPMVDTDANYGRNTEVIVDGALVDVDFALAGVERATRMPIRLHARPSAGAVDVASSLTVSLCNDWRCGLRQEIALPVPGDVEIEGENGPAGVLLQVRGPSSESSCCGARMTGAIVATTRDHADTQLMLQSDNPNEPITRMGWVASVSTDDIVAHPEILDGVRVLVLAEDRGHPVDELHALQPALRRFLARGGTLSIPAYVEHELALDAPDAPGARVLEGEILAGQRLTMGGRLTRPVLAAGTRVVPSQGGRVVVRGDHVAGVAPEDAEVFSVLAAYPTFFDESVADATGVAENAASVALAGGPPRALTFGLTLAGLVAIVVVMRRGRRAGLAAAPPARTLGRAAAIAAATCLALVVVHMATVPGERRARVVVWLLGKDGVRWEEGVDAVRPRSAREVSVRGPVPLTTLHVVGDVPPDSLWSSSEGDTVRTARVGPAAVLAGAWSRPAPPSPGVDIVDDRVVNHLPVPLVGILLGGEPRRHGPLAPGDSAPLSSFVTQAMYDAPSPPPGLAVEEARLLQDLVQSCGERRADHDSNGCAAAVARLDDGTLLGVEVRR